MVLSCMCVKMNNRIEQGLHVAGGALQIAPNLRSISESELNVRMNEQLS